MNRFLSYFSLLALIFWLFFSYWPTALLNSVQFVFPTAVASSFQWISIGIVALFLLIQLMLVRSAFLMKQIRGETSNGRPDGDDSREHGGIALDSLNDGVREPRLATASANPTFHISRTWEVVWTILPLLMTIGVAVVGYRLWLGL